jgi:hypothetical protein
MAIDREIWLSQFKQKSVDRETAEKLLKNIVKVSHNEFASFITEKIRNAFRWNSERVALFPEREVRKYRGVPNKLFKEKPTPNSHNPRQKNLRAIGAAPRPYHASRGDEVKIGSEGVVTSLIGQLARENKKFISIPSPNRMRKEKVRHFVVVSDLLGSGDRVWNFLQAAWRVRTIRSWHSLKLVTFTVVAYAGTQDGIRRIKSHPSKPRLIVGMKCPTTFSCFKIAERVVVHDLCRRYNPTAEDAFGYKGVGALIVFSHGCPNNAPPLLYSKTDSWLPLYPGRTAFTDFSQQSLVASEFNWAEGFRVLEYSGVEKSELFQKLPTFGKKLTLYLFANLVNRRLRAPDMERHLHAVRAGLHLSEVQWLETYALRHHLVDYKYKLTESGIGTVESFLHPPKVKGVENFSFSYYYPRQLRVPVKQI